MTPWRRHFRWARHPARLGPPFRPGTADWTAWADHHARAGQRAWQL